MVGLQGSGQVALSLQYIADIVVRNRELALPLRIIRIGLRQAVYDVESSLVGLITLIINYAWVLSHSFFNFLAGVNLGGFSG